MISYSVAIQAGGKSSRMGQDKGLMPFGDNSLVEYIYHQISGMGEGVFIVSNNQEEYQKLDIPVYSDVYKDLGALGGIHTILSHLDADYVLVLACDMPFVNIELVEFMLTLAPDFDVVVPRLGEKDFVEPFKAVYSKTCLAAVDAAIKNGKRRVISFFDDVRVRIVQPSEVKRFDPEYKSFINVNTPDDYQKALEIAGF
jgi:molybdopterin-guanine dinucleotide biosynthesis protein A